MRLERATAADRPAIERLLDEAFGTDRRRRTAYLLRAGLEPIAALSLVARDGDALVGSVQCWPIELASATATHAMTLLGPVAVARDQRARGIGATLMDAVLTAAGDAPMLLIGDEPYYGRWGFTAEPTAGWTLPGPVDRHRLLARAADRLPPHGTLRAARRLAA